MTELNSAFFILMAEALAVMIMLGVTLYVKQQNKRKKEISEIDDFIKRFTKEEELKSQLISTILLQECGVELDKVNTVLKQLGQAESELLRRIIEMFLQRNPALLPEIEDMINHLADPYFKLLADFHHQIDEQKEQLPLGDKDLKVRVIGIEKVNQQLMKQLDNAMETINDITNEYTRVFSGHQSELDLDSSGKRMLKIFHDAELRILHSNPDHKE